MMKRSSVEVDFPLGQVLKAGPPEVGYAMLCELQQGAVDLAESREDSMAWFADADALYAQLYGTGKRPVLAEGNLFPSAWWVRCGDGWRLRDLPQEMRA